MISLGLQRNVLLVEAAVANDNESVTGNGSTETSDPPSEPEFLHTGVPPQYQSEAEARRGTLNVWTFIQRCFNLHMEGVNNMEVRMGWS